MREKPILFSTEMVRAILDGRKTQTRRVMKPQPPEWVNSLYGPEWYSPAIIDSNGDLQEGKPIYGVYDDYGDFGVKCPYQPGGVLWVRETWADLRGMGFGNDPKTDKPWNFAYKADIKPGSDSDRARIDYGVKWKPSIYMPREAARLFLLVKNVRVERLREITEEDAIAEGIRIGIGGKPYFSCHDAFAALWDSINAKRGYGWDVNPWVWVIEFERAGGETE